jgi:hypothetical protein
MRRTSAPEAFSLAKQALTFCQRASGTLPSTISEAELETLNTGLAFLFNGLREAREEFDHKKDAGRSGSFRALGVLWQFIVLFKEPLWRCLRLSYESQVATARWRSIDRAQSIRMRLGGSPNVTEPFPERPRYMRRAKYERLREQALALQAEGLGTLNRSLDRRLEKGMRPSHRTRSTH